MCQMKVAGGVRSEHRLLNLMTYGRLWAVKTTVLCDHSILKCSNPVWTGLQVTRGTESIYLELEVLEWFLQVQKRLAQ